MDGLARVTKGHALTRAAAPGGRAVLMEACRSAQFTARAMDGTALQTGIWLRDGRPSVLIDASEIIPVMSAMMSSKS
jgi:hypothetical protein